MSRVPTTGAVVSNEIHSAIMARQGSRPQGIGYGDRKVLGARAIFSAILLSLVKKAGQTVGSQGHRDKLQNPGRILLNQGQLIGKSVRGRWGEKGWGRG